MERKVCVVTGACSGIGRATAVALARRGATVGLVCRNPDHGERAAAAVRAAAGHGRVWLELADFVSMAEVHALAGRLHDRLDRLDVLVNNAGQVLGQRTLTPDGLERTFAVNHLAPFLLTNRLLDLLGRSAPSRIVNVSSVLHRTARLDLDDLTMERGYRGGRAYANSKLANILFTYELARRLEGSGVAVNCAHPGQVRTGIARESGLLFRTGMRLGGPLLLSPERGADTIVHLASAPEVAGQSGRYWVRRRARRTSRASQDEVTARRLWRVSEELTGRALAESASAQPVATVSL